MENTYYIKMIGKANIPVPLEIGSNYTIDTQGSITEKRENDDFDGKLSVTYKFEPIIVTIKDNLGKSIRTKDPRRNSAKIRNMLWKEHFNEGATDDFDKVYDEATWVILSMMPQIYRDAIKRLTEKV